MKIQRAKDLPDWAADLFPWLARQGPDQSEEDLGDGHEGDQAGAPTAAGSRPVPTKIEVEEAPPEDRKWDQKYETKFSTELMLPLRRARGDPPAQWEPGMVQPQAGDLPLDPYEGIIATWPDGIEIKLDQNYGYLNGLQ